MHKVLNVTDPFDKDTVLIIDNNGEDTILCSFEDIIDEDIDENIFNEIMAGLEKSLA